MSVGLDRSACLVKALGTLAENVGVVTSTPDEEMDTLLVHRSVLGAVKEADLSLMVTKGLAHDHWTIDGTDFLLRVPKQSQMGLSARENLHYQKICFHRMAPSKHTPICYATIPPSSSLPMGALLVQRIYGREPQTKNDFTLIAKALASIHRLPVPPPEVRTPLLSSDYPLVSMLAEVEIQASYLSRAVIDPLSLSMIQAELELARKEVRALASPPVCLISFDAHPGNFIIDSQGKAVLVDLEKGRYGGCGFDLAHASLYTSTSWDVDVRIELSKKSVVSFYDTWSQHVSTEFADAMQPYMTPMRRLMWLWSVTWCAMWQLESNASALEQKNKRNNTRDWASENNPDELTAHVRERVSHYLQAETICRIREDLNFG